MTKLEHGEATVQLGGTDYRLKLGTNALIVLQEALSTAEKTPSIAEIFQGVSAGRVLYLRAFLWAALQKHYPTFTLPGVADLLDDADIPEIIRLLQSLGIATVPAPEDLKDLGVNPDARPQKARAKARAAKTGRGTGARSSSRRGASA